MRSGLAASVALVLALWIPAPADALGLGISTPSVTLASFGPGLTATGSGAVVVTGVLAPWTLTAQDSSNSGHLVSGGATCTGSEPQTVNALTASASGNLPTTHSAGAVTIGPSPATVATGSAADTVNLDYSIAIGRTEAMRAGCVFSTTVTLTVQ
jgi:hypothetical protein